MAIKIETILLPKELTVDSIVSLAIVYKYCKKKIIGLSKAKLEFRASLPRDKKMDYFLKKGVLPLIPLSENTLALEQIACYEESALDDYPIVNQTISALKYSKNILYKQGAVFSWGYLTELFKDDAKKLLNLTLPILEEYLEIAEKKRVELFDNCQKALEKGKLTSFSVNQNSKKLKTVFINYDSDDVIDYLFYKKEVMADIVSVFKSNGNIIIKAKKEKHIDLLDVIAILRIETARYKKIPFDKINKHVLNRSGVMEGIEYWNFDPVDSEINSIKSVNLDKLIVKKAMLIGLDLDKMAKGECPPRYGCRGKKCSFYSYNMLRCRKRRAGVKDSFQQSNSSDKKSIRVLRR